MLDSVSFPFILILVLLASIRDDDNGQIFPSMAACCKCFLDLTINICVLFLVVFI